MILAAKCKVKHDGFYSQKDVAIMFHFFFVLLAETMGWHVPGCYKDATYLAKISYSKAFSLSPTGEKKVSH